MSSRGIEPEAQPLPSLLLHPILQDPKSLAAVGGLILILLFLTFLRPSSKRTSKRSGTPTVLLAGPSDAGKTSLFVKVGGLSLSLSSRSSRSSRSRGEDGANLQLTQDDLASTHTSMTPSITTFPLKTEDGSKPIRLVDLPGHPRLRDESKSHLREAAGAIFVVDVQSIIRNAGSVSEELAPILSSLANTAYRSNLPMQLLILAHKSDLLIRPTVSGPCPTIPSQVRNTAIERVKSILSREMDRLKSARVTTGGRIEGIGKVSSGGGSLWTRIFGGGAAAVTEGEEVEEDESLMWGGKGSFRWEDVEGVDITWGASGVGSRDAKSTEEEGEGLDDVKGFLWDL